MNNVVTRTRRKKQPAPFTQERLEGLYEHIRDELPKSYDDLCELVAFHGGVGCARAKEVIKLLLENCFLKEKDGEYHASSKVYFDEVKDLLPIAKDNLPQASSDAVFEQAVKDGYIIIEDGQVRLNDTPKADPSPAIKSISVQKTPKGQYPKRKDETTKDVEAVANEVGVVKPHEIFLREIVDFLPASKNVIIKKLTARNPNRPVDYREVSLFLEALVSQTLLVKQGKTYKDPNSVSPKAEAKKGSRRKVKKLKLAEVVAAFEMETPLTAYDLANKLGLDFSKGSKDRMSLADALDILRASGVIDLYDDKFVRHIKGEDAPSDGVVGVIVKKGEHFYFQPSSKDSKAIYMEHCDYTDGSIVTVLLNDNRDKVSRVVIEHANINDAEGASILSAEEAGIPREFSQDVLDETIGMEVPEAGNGHVDYTKLPFFTIDPKTAKDFDDAICVRKHKGNWIVQVAIADVSHYVRPGSKLWLEALKRGNTTYLPGLVISMLPKILADRLCSLTPNENRAAIVTTMHIDKNGKILSEKVEKAVIRSRARLNYDEVQEAIDGFATGKTREFFNKYIVKAKDAAVDLMKEAEERGMLDLSVSEQRVDISARTGVQISEERNTLSHQIIAALMIANNRSAIKVLKKEKKPLLSREHASPRMKKYGQYIRDLERLGVVPKNDLPLPERLRDMAKQTLDLPKRKGQKARHLIIRMQEQARYVYGDADHYGLALEGENGYGHFTSPIRRFADLVLHALITGAYKEAPEFFEKENLVKVAKHISMTERRSEMAERRAKERILAGWVAGNMGKIFNATVVGVDEESQEIELKGIGHGIHTYVATGGGKFKKGDVVEMTPVKADKITGVLEFRLAANINSARGANDNKQSPESPKIAERQKSPRKRASRNALAGMR